MLEDVERSLGAGILVGTTCFFAAMITWVDRARRGAVVTTIASAALAGMVSWGTPIWISSVLPNALASDLAHVAQPENLGALAGWILAFIAGAFFFATAASEWTTLKYAKSWDAPLSTGRPSPMDEEPLVTAPPDRIRRLEMLRKAGTISDEDLTTQKARILSREGLVGPIPIPPNSGSRKAARAHIEYLRGSGRYAPEEIEAQKERILRAYGLSADFQFPEEELQALVIRRQGGVIDEAEFDQQKKRILDRI